LHTAIKVLQRLYKVLVFLLGVFTQRCVRFFKTSSSVRIFGIQSPDKFRNWVIAIVLLSLFQFPTSKFASISPLSTQIYHLLGIKMRVGFKEVTPQKVIFDTTLAVALLASSTVALISSNPSIQKLKFSEQADNPPEAIKSSGLLKTLLLNEGIHFPQPGEGIQFQDQRTPEEVGLSPTIIEDVDKVIAQGRWAIWRYGYLVHIEGDFNANSEVRSLRKTFFALAVGSALQSQRIPSIDQSLSHLNLQTNNQKLTWHHLLNQTSGLYSAQLTPGEEWAYHDFNPYLLCQALSSIYGKSSYEDNFSDVIGEALLNPIGAQGWSTKAEEDGVRLVLDLEDLGRIGTLLIAHGKWNEKSIVPEGFVEELSTKQTYGIQANYTVNSEFEVTSSQGQNRWNPSGIIKAIKNQVRGEQNFQGMHVKKFSESPYGYMAWVNTDQDLWPGVSPKWSMGYGAGGNLLIWNLESGLVLAALDSEFNSPGFSKNWPMSASSLIRVLEKNTLEMPEGPTVQSTHIE
jgi:CubicO group peptidase (beta-lactamase class C family)